MTVDLHALGWTPAFAAAFEPHEREGLVPARVVAQHRGEYDVVSERGELRAEVTGRLLHEAAATAELPVVGDWVALAPRPGERTATIQAVLPRRTKFSRKVAWQAAEEQVLCANVDTVFIVSSLNEDYNLRRLERYLTLAWESGAQPVIVLTKTDLSEEVERLVAEVGLDRLRRPGARDLQQDRRGARRRAGLHQARRDGRAARLLRRRQVHAREHARRRGAAARAGDPRGRQGPAHDDPPPARRAARAAASSSTRRACASSSSGRPRRGCTTPSRTSRRSRPACRFSDCAHKSEPGCAVQAALADGRLAPERWESYLKLEAELEHLTRKLDKRAQAEYRRR